MAPPRHTPHPLMRATRAPILYGAPSPQAFIREDYHERSHVYDWNCLCGRQKFRLGATIHTDDGELGSLAWVALDPAATL